MKGHLLWPILKPKYTTHIIVLFYRYNLLVANNWLSKTRRLYHMVCDHLVNVLQFLYQKKPREIAVLYSIF